MGERLEVHCFAGVLHLFPETKQMEGGVRADLILHACKEIRPRRPLDLENKATPFFGMILLNLSGILIWH
jgi:hypothetical protein